MTIIELQTKLMQLQQNHPNLTLPFIYGKDATAESLQELYNDKVQEAIAGLREKLMKLQQKHPNLTLPFIFGKDATIEVLQKLYNDKVQEIKDN